jgi:hypothetical protein
MTTIQTSLQPCTNLFRALAFVVGPIPQLTVFVTLLIFESNMNKSSASVIDQNIEKTEGMGTYIRHTFTPRALQQSSTWWQIISLCTAKVADLML